MGASAQKGDALDSFSRKMRELSVNAGGVGQSGKKVAAALEVPGAIIRQGHASRGAVEKTHAEPRFQLGHCAGDRRS